MASKFLGFAEWLKIKESSAFTRTREDAARGLKPPIPARSIHSRSTAPPWMVKKLSKKKSKRKKKKE